MMGKVMMSGIVPLLVAPVTGIQLGTIAEGSIVKLNENGSPVEFYVSKHNYESGLNGAGRTLLVRKECHSNGLWHVSGGTNAYSSCLMDTWFNGTYKSSLDDVVKTLISETKFYCSVGARNGTVTTLSRSVFTLSMTELGFSYNYAPVEGSKLSTSSVLCNTSNYQWTRTAHSGSGNNAFYVQNGTSYSWTDGGSSKAYYGYRPCFTLPSGALFNEKTMQFIGKVK